MKYYLLSIFIILTISFTNSYSQSVKQLSRRSFFSNASNQNIPLTDNSSGIIFDSNKYKKSENIVEQDTSKIKNEISAVYSSDQIRFNVQIKLNEYNIPIKLSVFNMLGNLVKGIYEGNAIKGVEYPFDATNLPNGLYLCIMEGPNFRDAEKFTISR